ncbi:MAG TPA: hypothetical protein H9821_05120 [Candidatus Rothia avicola]|uniref:Uncharacterized protein n=1 Tax=Candidatus Rothia avicola TaxID=2840478 RepID=A0A9D2CQY3_9MICC|nr:hypothetical protein [Candidatus Rothia avicola]
MAEKKTAAHAAAGLQPGSGTTPAAHQVLAVTDETMQRAYEALLADLVADGFTAADATAPAGGSSSEVKRAPDFARGLGQTLHDADLVARFEGVKENLSREIRGGMCTPDQAYAYLENLEISLLLEQEALAASSASN